MNITGCTCFGLGDDAICFFNCGSYQAKVGFEYEFLYIYIWMSHLEKLNLKGQNRSVGVISIL